MGNAILQIFSGSCLHDYALYVFNDSECHTACGEFITCDCETHPTEIPDDSSELSVETECCIVRKK